MSFLDDVNKAKQNRINPTGPVNNINTVPDNISSVQDTLKKTPMYIPIDQNNSPEPQVPTTQNPADLQNLFDEAVLKKDYNIESPEEKQKRERQQAIGAGLTGLGTGLSNLANLYYTTQGAPDQKIGNSGIGAYQDALKNSENIRLNNWQNYLNAKRQIDARRDAYNQQSEINKQRLQANSAEKELQRQFLNDRDTRNNDLKIKLANDKALSDKERESLRHKFRTEEIDQQGGWRIRTKETPSVSSSTSSKQTLNLTNKNGQSISYNMKDPSDVVQMYQDGVKAGLFDDYDLKQSSGVYGKSPTPTDIKNYIYSKLNNGVEKNETPAQATKKTINGFSGSSQKSNKKTIKGF